jgi:hypothetical protein
VYIALSILPLIALNAPYQMALTTLLQACLSLIHISNFVSSSARAAFLSGS